MGTTFGLRIRIRKSLLMSRLRSLADSMHTQRARRFVVSLLDELRGSRAIDGGVIGG